MGKNGFLLFNNYQEYFSLLNNEEAGELIKAIFNYCNNLKVDKLSARVECFFIVIKQHLDKQAEEYNRICEKNRKNVEKRWQNANVKNKKENNTKNTTVNLVKNKILYKKEKEIKEEIKNNNKEDIKAKELAVVKTTAQTQQVEVFNYFAKLYKAETNIDYLGKGIDYINLAKLIKKYGKALVIQKINWLLVGCKNNVFFFSKDMTDFNISTLTAQWDRILPKLTDEQKKEQDKLKKETEKKKWVMEQLKKQGIEIDENSSKGGLSVIS